MVQPNTSAALKYVKSLPEGYVGTYDNPPRKKPVPDDVVLMTLPFMSPRRCHQTIGQCVRFVKMGKMDDWEIWQWN